MFHASTVLALRATLAILDDLVNPAIPLVLYWPGKFKRVHVPRALGNASHTAERAAPFYAKCVRVFQDLQRLMDDINCPV